MVMCFAVVPCHPHGQAWRGDGGYTFDGGESQPRGRRSRSGSCVASELSDFASPFVYLKSFLAQGGQ